MGDPQVGHGFQYKNCQFFITWLGEFCMILDSSWQSFGGVADVQANHMCRKRWRSTILGLPGINRLRGRFTWPTYYGFPWAKKHQETIDWGVWMTKTGLKWSSESRTADEKKGRFDYVLWWFTVSHDILWCFMMFHYCQIKGLSPPVALNWTNLVYGPCNGNRLPNILGHPSLRQSQTLDLELARHRKVTQTLSVEKVETTKSLDFSTLWGCS